MYYNYSGVKILHFNLAPYLLHQYISAILNYGNLQTTIVLEISAPVVFSHLCFLWQKQMKNRIWSSGSIIQKCSIYVFMVFNRLKNWYFSRIFLSVGVQCENTQQYGFLFKLANTCIDRWWPGKEFHSVNLV